MNLSYLNMINFQIQTKILCTLLPFISILSEDDYGALAEWYWQGKPKYTERNMSKWHRVYNRTFTVFMSFKLVYTEKYI